MSTSLNYMIAWARQERAAVASLNDVRAKEHYDALLAILEPLKKKADGDTAISLWMPMDDPVAIAAIGKLIEELGEAVSASGRSLIQGMDGADPGSGKKNSQWLADELDDVSAAKRVVREFFGLHFNAARRVNKRSGFLRWHDMIREVMRSTFRTVTISPGNKKVPSRLMVSHEVSLTLRPMTDPACRDGRYINLFMESGYTTTPLRSIICRYDPAYRMRQPWVDHANNDIFDGGQGKLIGWLPVPDMPPKEPPVTPDDADED